MKRFSIIIKSLTILAVVYGLTTVEEGWSTLTKFTTLSNVGVGIAMLLFLIAEVVEDRKGTKVRTKGWYNFKFTMTTAIALTFFVFLLILAPTSPLGFVGAYLNHRCGSLAHHVIVPVLAVVDFYVNDRGYVPSKKAAVGSILFPILYVVMIVLIASTGYRWSDGMSAPYNFLNFGAPVGWWGFDLSTMGKTSLGIGAGYMTILLSILFVLMALLMRYIKLKLTGRQRKTDIPC